MSFLSAVSYVINENFIQMNRAIPGAIHADYTIFLSSFPKQERINSKLNYRLGLHTVINQVLFFLLSPVNANPM